MLRTIVWFLYFWLYLLICLPLSGWMHHLEKKGDIAALDRHVSNFVRNWADRLLRLAGARVRVTGLENLPENAFVAVSNHQGNFDIPIMLAKVGKPRGLVAKRELGRIPGIRTWMRYLHCLFIDRSSARAGAQVIVDGEALLREGHSLTIFPEGTRGRGGPMGTFKPGAFRIATRAGAPVVPVTINGSYKLMEANHMRIQPADVVVTVHPPIQTAGASREQIRALPDQVKQIIASAL